MRSYLNGSSIAFHRQSVLARYADLGTYLARFRAAADRAVEAGVLLPRDVEPLVDEARADWPLVVHG